MSTSRQQAEPHVNPAHHDHDFPPFEIAGSTGGHIPFAGVKVPLESIVFRTDLHTVFSVDPDELPYGKYDAWDWACDMAWERFETYLPRGQWLALAHANWPEFNVDQFHRACAIFGVGPVTGYEQ